MNTKNYDKEMQKIIAGLSRRPRLLLHCCCAPCSTYCLEILAGAFDVTAVFYNPNIDSAEEYAARRDEQKRFTEEFSRDVAAEIKFTDCGYTPGDFQTIAKGRENLPERGARCADCYRLRLEKAASLCSPGDFFATTLTVSPLKLAGKINELGFALAEKYGVAYLPSDFKKRNGYFRSVELSKKYNLYRQSYCGCAYSKKVL